MITRLNKQKIRRVYNTLLKVSHLMGLIDSLKNRYTRDHYVDPGVRICVECGSMNTTVYGKYMVCRECKAIRHFKIKLSRFHPGDLVRIVEGGKDSEIIYKIKKMNKSYEGTVLYILKPESIGKEVLFYQGKDAHLQRIIESRTIKKKNHESRNSHYP
ncbi:MAG: hypothetical protein NPMRTH4_380005 [Nitrosopumilales archaeon]|nr:MAG: hypothetical protein NPMRTH4_380005 [Nitrosopumilales archaeon]